MTAALLMLAALQADPAQPEKEEPKLYSVHVKEPGFEMALKEVKRTRNTSTLESRIVTPDAQGGPFTMIAAACEIGKAMKLRYFTALNSTTKDDVNTTVLYLTNDPKEPAPKGMSKESREAFEKTGYLDTEVYRRLFERNHEK